MRKLIVSMNVTLNGFMAGPNSELDWHFKSWDEEMAHAITLQLSAADTILLGRITYSIMARYWPSIASAQFTCRHDLDFADMMNRYDKVIFSTTLSSVDEWRNARLAKKNIEEEIAELKQSRGKEMIIYGSGQMVSSLITMNLIDEYRIWIHPVIINQGRPFFPFLSGSINLKLRHSTAFGSGVVLLCYERIS
ncbi:MAG: dihydrofolate reductase family protein [Flavitalea sp.]